MIVSFWTDSEVQEEFDLRQISVRVYYCIQKTKVVVLFHQLRALQFEK